MNNEKIKNIISYFFVVCFVLMVTVVSIFSIVQKDETTSFLENRKLIQFITPTPESLINGTWFADFEKYSKDQVVEREKWMETYYTLLDALQVKERNNFVRGKDEFILPVNDLPSENQLNASYHYGERQVAALQDIQCAANIVDAKLLYVNIPSKAELFSENYPDLYYSRMEQNAIERESILQKVKASGIETVETYDLLFNHKDEYIYYATDHHFTIKGAYYVYLAILEKINSISSGNEALVFPEWDTLNIQRNSNRMAGSYLRSWGDSKKISVDYMEYALPYDMPEFTRIDNGQLVENPVLFNKYNTNYTTFMGGDIGNTVIDTGRDNLPSILYIGFSFTNALETLSVYNFNKTESLDPRHWEGNICEYITENEPDYIVVIRDDIYQENPQFRCTVR